MTVATEPMPRHKSSEPKRNDIAVKIAADVVRMGRLIAADTTRPLAEVISEAARPALEAQIAELREKLPKPKKH